MLAASLTVLAACGSSPSTGATPAPTGVPNLGTVSFRTGAESIIGPDIPFVIAEQKGFYAAHGLTVTFNTGTGYATALRTVASGADQYSESDVATIAKGVAQGLPVQSVAIYVENNPAGLIFHTSKSISGPSSIAGLNIGGTAGSGSKGIFDTWVAVNHISTSSFTFNNISGHAKAVLFSEGKLDAYIGLAFDDYPDAQKLEGDKVGFYYFAASGVTVPGLAIAASSAEISAHPDRVKAFIAATAEGAAYGIAHPDEVPGFVTKLEPNTDAALVAAQWAIVRDSMKKFAIAGKPFGYQTQEAWTETAKLFAPANASNTSVFYTNNYLGH